MIRISVGPHRVELQQIVHTEFLAGDAGWVTVEIDGREQTVHLDPPEFKAYLVRMIALTGGAFSKS